MSKSIVPLTAENFERIVKETCCQLQQPGHVVLVPTETVYGLCCRWNDKIGRNAIYRLKHREQEKPLQMLCANFNQAQDVGVLWNLALESVCKAFCPGPLTLVADSIQPGVTIGFRIPDHPFVQAVLKQVGQPLAATSANRSGEPNCLSVEDALRQLDGAPHLCIDAGPLSVDARPSTVVRIFPDSFTILRPGPVTEAEIRNVFFGNRETD